VTVEIQLPERFRIDREIGRGGMAVVYRAHDRHLDRFVAIKVLSTNVSHAMGVERFQREIALMAKLVHPGIVALFDSGEVNGRLYYVMPFVAGENLRARLQRERRMSVDDAIGFGADVCEALAYAHGAGIVHRDVKPENVFSVSGRAVLADFGIAHIAGGADTRTSGLTSDGMVLGTVAYMSPEQASGAASIDGRSDLYSLGCVLYEMLTGGPPFSADQPMAMMMKHLTEVPRPVRERNEAVHGVVSDLIDSLLSKQPDSRPASAGDVARALRAARNSGETVAAPVPPSDANRLADEGFHAIHYGMNSGPAVRSHLEQAGVYFKRALALEPRNARALTGMANWHYTMARAGLMPKEEAFARGREYILDALAADDRCAEVHNSLGKISLLYDDDAHAALRHVERSVSLDPGDAEARRFLSVVYKVLGRVDESIAAARAATKLNPDLAGLWNGLGDALMVAGRNAEAVDALRRAISLQPAHSPALERMEIARARLGELEAAVEARVARLMLAGQSERANLLTREAESIGPDAARRADQVRELEALLAEAERSDPFADPWGTRTTGDRIILAYALLGDWTRAMDWVERAYAARPIRLRRTLTELPFDRRGLAADPRYTRLLRVAALEDLL
jgi:tetratricopeptide (TPR) repeat protein